MDPEAENKPSEGPSPSLSNSDSDSDAAPQQTEWLATAREKRSTAGNRMKAMLAAEEPDDDLELLFAEDEDDQGFSDVDAGAGSDVHMDSSSDDEDDNAAADDDEGEKELEKQDKEARRAAQRKRKAQETAIPAKFRKKVRIDPTTTTGPAAPAAPPSRPKKKSERASWLPTEADMPTRASSRSTTRMSKEQLHQQMVEREKRRLKQVAQMAKKAARDEALRKPPMTQEERLREAAAVERRNAKSLNRWEVAERQREEERLAKLAALNERTLKGPVITFWSGWVDGKAKGRHFVVEETKKKKEKKDKDKGKLDSKAEVPGKDGKPAEGSETTGTKDGKETALPVDAPESKETNPESKTGETTSNIEVPTTTTEESRNVESQIPGKESVAAPPPAPLSTENSSTPKEEKQETTPGPMAMPVMPPPPEPQAQPSGLAAPAPLPENQGRLFSPPDLAHPQDSKPSGVLAAPMLAPPPDVNSAPGGNAANTTSSVLALPNTSQQSAPLAVSSSTPKPSPDTAESVIRDTSLQPIQSQAAALNTPSNPSEPPESSSPIAASTKNAIVFQNFNENALRDKSVQNEILFGRKMTRLAKPSPTVLCAITNHPARYRDPKTGLAYHNAQAYREIQRLRRGEYKWSRLLGAWAGSGTYAARGVPERFLHPGKKREAKEEQKTSENKAVEKETPAKTEGTATEEVKQGVAAKTEEGTGQPPQPVMAAAQAV